MKKESQSKPPSVKLPMVIGMWKQKDNLRALIIAPHDRKQTPKWYLEGEEVSGYKIVDIDLYKETVKFESAGTVYEVGLENKSRAARKPLPRKSKVRAFKGRKKPSKESARTKRK